MPKVGDKHQMACPHCGMNLPVGTSRCPGCRRPMNPQLRILCQAVETAKERQDFELLHKHLESLTGLGDDGRRAAAALSGWLQAQYDDSIKEGRQALKDGDPEAALECAILARRINPVGGNHALLRREAEAEVPKAKRVRLSRAIRRGKIRLAGCGVFALLMVGLVLMLSVLTYMWFTKENGRQAYEAARNIENTGSYEAAVQALEEFVKRYPASDYAAPATERIATLRETSAQSAIAAAAKLAKAGKLTEAHAAYSAAAASFGGTSAVSVVPARLMEIEAALQPAHQSAGENRMEGLP